MLPTPKGGDGMTIPTTTPGTLGRARTSSAQPHVHLKLRNSIALLAAAIAITAALLGGIRPTTADASIAEHAHSASTTAATNMKRGTAKLGDLYVVSTEDVSGAFGNGDELYIRSGGKVIWRAQGSVEEGSGSVAVNRKVKIGATVKLYDADGGPDSDDLLGAGIVRASGESLSFTNDDANYTLDYQG
jgi:hypothetical protein